MYERLGREELRSFKVMFQLDDRSTRLPRGVVGDVLVKVEEFIFSIDFVALDIEMAPNVESYIPLILGHPFLATSNALIN